MKITPIQTGQVQIKSRHLEPRFAARPARIIDILADRNWSPRLPIRCFTIEHPEGLIVVDTGESSHSKDPGYAPRWHLFANTCERNWVQPDEESGPQLLGLGLDPAAVCRRHNVVIVPTHDPEGATRLAGRRFTEVGDAGEREEQQRDDS